MKVKNFNKMIQIPKASFDDAGEYVCTATNKINYIQHTIAVSVKGETLSETRWMFFLHSNVVANIPAPDSGSILVGEAHKFGVGP